MKREFLKELELTDEVIDKIMAENGKDIEKHKTQAETVRAELDTVKGQLSEANKQIEGFKDLDVDGIKKAAEIIDSGAALAKLDRFAAATQEAAKA